MKRTNREKYFKTALLILSALLLMLALPGLSIVTVHSVWQYAISIPIVLLQAFVLVALSFSVWDKIFQIQDRRWGILYYDDKCILELGNKSMFPDLKIGVLRKYSNNVEWRVQGMDYKHPINMASPYAKPMEETTVIVGVFDLNTIEGRTLLARSIRSLVAPATRLHEVG